MTAARKSLGGPRPNGSRSRGPRGRRAFSLVELIIAIVVMAILGGTVVSALWLVLNMFRQTGDYIVGREEIEIVAQFIGREISNVGLAMPNNRKGEGSFAASFQMGSNSPIMGIMGSPAEAWGGPITLGLHNSSNVYTKDVMVQTLTTDGGKSFYQGPELYYAWGVPTNVKVRYTDASDRGIVKTAGDSLELEVLESAGMTALLNFTYDLRNIGIKAGNGRNPSSWILFPTSRIPMLIDDINTGARTLSVRVAPGSPLPLSGPFTGLDEVCLPQTARLFRNGNGELTRLFFGTDSANNITTTQNILARNVAGLHFTYDPQLRLLSMYIAVHGEEGNVHGAVPPNDIWPPFADALPQGRRLVVNRIDWRIRN
jgi:prepilin-type N-terminal cleavage/methylation domain-containing protein